MFPPVQERTHQYRFNEAIVHILEPSADWGLAGLAESNISDEEYVPKDGECMNDVNPETDESVEGSASDREANIQPHLYSDTFKGQ